VWSALVGVQVILYLFFVIIGPEGQCRPDLCWHAWYSCQGNDPVLGWGETTLLCDPEQLHGADTHLLTHVERPKDTVYDQPVRALCESK